MNLGFSRFYMAQVGLEQALEAAVKANEPAFRPNALMLFASDLLVWFDSDPALKAVRLSCVAQAQTEAPYEVRMRHHFKLTAEHEGGENKSGMPLTQDDVHAYALQRLPWKQMADGSFYVERDSPLMHQLLHNIDPMEALELESGLYLLASQISLAFQAPSVIHDLGLDSAYSDQ